MVRNLISAQLGALFAAALLLMSTGIGMAQTAVGTVVESRIIVGLKVDADKLGTMMPEGWMPIAFPAGPLTGANAMMNFLDGHAVVDTDGKTTGTRLTAALIALGKPAESKDVRLFVLRVYTDDPEANPYGNTHAAEITRAQSLTTGGDGDQTFAETWGVTLENGERIDFSLDYRMGLPGLSSGTSKAFSAEDPDMAVTQTYQQIADLAHAPALGREIDGTVTLASTVGELALLLDGSEEIAAVVNIPVYTREVFLP
jgi:hypothetical protein